MHDCYFDERDRDNDVEEGLQDEDDEYEAVPEPVAATTDEAE